MGATAATRRANTQRVLRACVVQNGHVVEEQLLKRNQPLSVGTGPKNTFVFGDTRLPKSHDLFAVAGSKYELVFTEAMRGKVAAQGDRQPTDFASLKQQGLVKRKGDFYVLPLTESHRGKVVIGDATIIFQFVQEPPAAARARLPPEARGTFKSRVDWAYALALLGILLIEVPVVVSLFFVEPSEELTIDKIDERWANLIIPELKKQEKKPEQKEEAKPSATEAKKEAAKSEDKPADDPAAASAKKAARQAGVRKNVEGKGVLAVIGGLGGDSAGGAVADVFGGAGLGGDLDSAFEGISGVGLATSAGSRTTRGGGSGEAASIGGLATSGGGDVGLGDKAERRVGEVKAAAPEVDGSLDSGAVARVVKSRMRSIQDCYEKELKRNPNLAGKIEIEFTIDESGRVDEARVASNKMGSDAVAECIVSRIQRWRFPKPDGGSVTVNYPFIFSAAN